MPPHDLQKYFKVTTRRMLIKLCAVSGPSKVKFTLVNCTLWSALSSLDPVVLAGRHFRDTFEVGAEARNRDSDWPEEHRACPGDHDLLTKWETKVHVMEPPRATQAVIPVGFPLSKSYPATRTPPLITGPHKRIDAIGRLLATHGQ